MQDEDEPVVMSKKPSPYAQYEYDDEPEEDVEEATVKIRPDEEQDSDEEAQLAVDVYETNDAIYVKTMTAGVKKEDLEITVSREAVTIRGRRENDSRSYQNDYHIHELYWGPFSRTIDLPEEVDIELANAAEHHGLVTIKLPKFDKKRQATLRIQ